jgi:Fe-S oxidoreductase
VFRDEVKDLMPHDHHAQRLSKQSFTLAEFLETKTVHYSPPKLDCKVVVHGHCHQKAIVGMTHEASLLKKMGADADLLDSGCCGMAGSFGFEKRKYHVSESVFQHELQAHVENASNDAIFVADGFSCKTQIKQSSDRQALHLAQVMKLAVDREQQTDTSKVDENSCSSFRRNDGYVREWITAGIAALLVGVGAMALRRSKHSDDRSS